MSPTLWFLINGYGVYSLARIDNYTAVSALVFSCRYESQGCR